MSGMFDFLADVAETDVGIKAFNEAIAELKSYEVLVGIPEENNGRPAEGSVAVSNAELLYIHTHGSPINGIPARPVIEPALEHEKERVSELLQNAADVALSGNKEGVLPALEKAGMFGQNAVRAWFTNPSNEWAENSDITIKGGWMKNKVSGKVFRVKGKKSNRPLIDTGEMRKSIIYKVKKV